MPEMVAAPSYMVGDSSSKASAPHQNVERQERREQLRHVATCQPICKACRTACQHCPNAQPSNQHTCLANCPEQLITPTQTANWWEQLYGWGQARQQGIRMCPYIAPMLCLTTHSLAKQTLPHCVTAVRTLTCDMLIPMVARWCHAPPAGRELPRGRDVVAHAISAAHTPGTWEIKMWA